MLRVLERFPDVAPDYHEAYRERYGNQPAPSYASEGISLVDAIKEFENLKSPCGIVLEDSCNTGF